ncbi:MAG: PAS domain S-box protein [Thermodesulfobacteriota bacterium]|nr:PAS domain S-box protein [Thermodesulfobacteriota bacterium]
MIVSLFELSSACKYGVMALLMTLAAALTIYYHYVLGTGTVFTHFYYLPIVLACIWWKRRGIAVAGMLALILVISHLLFRFDDSFTNDGLRIVMFFMVGTASVLLSEDIAHARQRAIDHWLLYKTIFQNTGTAIAIVEGKGRLAMVNNRFELLSGMSAVKLEKIKNLLDFIPASHHQKVMQYYHSVKNDAGSVRSHLELPFAPMVGEKKVVQITFSLIPGSQQVVATLSDLTDLKNAMEEQKRIKSELADTLAKVLSGYLPICSRCKKIRETSGRWKEVESYIHHRTNADFTHTLCPDCAQHLYPELLEYMDEAEKQRLFSGDAGHEELP